MEISVSFLPGEIVLSAKNGGRLRFSYRSFRVSPGIWPHICQYTPPPPSSGQARGTWWRYISYDRLLSVGSTCNNKNINIQSNLCCALLHVRHHLYLQILDQLHFSLVKLGHRHPHTFMEPGFITILSLYSESSFSTLSIISFRFCI